MAVASFAALYLAVALIPPRFSNWGIPLFLTLADICIGSLLILLVPVLKWCFEKYDELLSWKDNLLRKIFQPLYDRVDGPAYTPPSHHCTPVAQSGGNMAIDIDTGSVGHLKVADTEGIRVRQVHPAVVLKALPKGFSGVLIQPFS